MSSIIKRPVLVLNLAFEPSQVTTVKNAVKLIAKSAAIAVDELERELRPGFPVPTVIRLTRHNYIPHRGQNVNRKHLYLRDKYTCQYCYKKFSSSDLTLDHIIPQSRGGKNLYHNLATACKKCNHSKADRTPDEAGMVLLHKYRPVNIHTSKFTMRAMGENDEHWRKYLYFENTCPQQD